MVMRLTRHTHVVLANVHALAADLDGDVHAVVDEQRDAEAAGDGVQLPGRVDGFGAGAVLVAILQHGDAAAQRGLDDGAEVAGAEDRGRRVGDEVDAVVDGGFGHCLVSARFVAGFFL